MDSRKIYKTLLRISTQLRSCHWNTRSIATHHYGDMALEIDSKIDEFVESFQGKTGDLMLSPGGKSINIEVFAEELSVDMISEMIYALEDALILIRAEVKDYTEIEDIVNDIRNTLNTLQFHLNLS